MTREVLPSILGERDVVKNCGGRKASGTGELKVLILLQEERSGEGDEQY